jgi:hypothetical protein
LILPTQIGSDDFEQISGRVDLRMDPQGRLVSLRAMPNWDPKAPASASDWNRVTEAAGLDSSRWTPDEPQKAPASAFDERRAWLGSYSELPQAPVRIEAAAWKGRLVSFEIYGPWRPTGGGATNSSGSQSGGVFATINITIQLLPLFACVFALRNFRNGRGDVDGAIRSAAFIAMCTVIANLLGVPHGAAILFRTSQNGLSFGVLAWALYMSVEPYVRRHWPQALIGWTRALGGNFRDPIVAGHILVGIAVGIATDLLIGNFHGVRSGQFTPVPGATGIVANWLGDLAIPPLIALAIAFLFVLLRLVLRRGWIAAAIIGVLVAVRLANGSLVELPLSIVGTALLLGVSIRFGILALSITIIVNPLDRYPLTPNLSAWFAPQGWLEVAFVLAVSLWAFRNALGGRKVWKGDLLDG